MDDFAGFENFKWEISTGSSLTSAYQDNEIIDRCPGSWWWYSYSESAALLLTLHAAEESAAWIYYYTTWAFFADSALFMAARLPKR